MIPVAAALVVALAPAPAIDGAGGTPLGGRAVLAPRTMAASPEGAEPDTSLGGFLRSLSDSTDRFFGISAARPDTQGYDSLLAYRLEHPLVTRQRLSSRLGLRPEFGFNRVDGPVWGGALGIGGVDGLGRLSGEAAYAAGPNVWLGGGDYRKSLRRDEASWSLRVRGGRETASMDRDRPGLRLAALRALLNGKDYKRYLRRDGFELGLERQTQIWRAWVGYRDMLESPLATTTTWNFSNRDPAVFENLPAAFGRAREFELGAALRLPFLPITAEARHQTSGDAIGSDFEYRRTRIAVSGDFALGRLASLVPQVAYGRLSGSAVPQASFYLGGSQSLRSLHGGARGGTGLALARLDLIGATDVLKLAHVPHPEAFPIQAGLFAGAGAVWGTDPYGGPARPGVDWPHEEDWLSEVGVALHYQPGIPDPDGFIRLSYAWPLGPAREPPRLAITYTRPLDLVGAFDR